MTVWFADGRLVGRDAQYVVEDRRLPVSTNLGAAVDVALAECSAPPPAFVWNDVVAVLSRGGRWDYRCLYWPLGDPLLVDQLDVSGRCAVRTDLMEDGDDTASALARLLHEAPGSVVELGGVYRFTGWQCASAYRPIKTVAPAATTGRISVIVNYRDRPELMKACLASIASQQVTAATELLLVDNQSRPENRRLVEAYGRSLPAGFMVRHLEYNAPFNKSVQDNMAAEAATGEVLLLLNNDARLLETNVLQTLADWAMVPGVASAGPRFVGRRGRLVSAGVQTAPAADGRPAIIRETEIEALSRTVHDSAGASFACAAVRRAVWHELGGCDAEAFVSQYNDADFDLRALAAGYRHIYVGSSTVRHEPGTSEKRSRELLEPLREKLRRRHPGMGDFWRLDPAIRRLTSRPAFAETLPRALLHGARFYAWARGRLVRLARSAAA